MERQCTVQRRGAEGLRRRTLRCRILHDGVLRAPALVGQDLYTVVLGYYFESPQSYFQQRFEDAAVRIPACGLRAILESILRFSKVYQRLMKSLLCR